MHSQVRKYSDSAGAFQTKCDHVWFRQFRSPIQQEILKRGNACLVTYATLHGLPFGGESKMVEQTVMKLTLESTNSFVDDIVGLSEIIKHFEPAGFEIVVEDDTYEDEEAILVMWWRRGMRKHTPETPLGESVEVLKVWQDMKFDAVFRNLPSGRASFVYELGDGEYLVADKPLDSVHIKAFSDGA